MSTDPILDQPYENDLQEGVYRNPEYDNIGGWLVLVAIGLVISPLMLSFNLLTYFSDFLDPATWEALNEPGIYHPLLKPLIAYEIVGNISFLVFVCVVLYYFFSKKKELPRLIIIFYIGNLLFLGFDYYLSEQIPLIADDPAGAADSIKQIIRGIISTAIWVPYFIVSERVNGTFVH